MTTIPLFVDFCVGNNKLHEVSQIYIQPDWWKKRLIMTQVIPIDPSDVLRKIKTTQGGEFQSCSTCSAKWNAFEDSPRVECLFKSGLVQIPVSSQQRSIVRAKVFPLLLFRPTHPPFAHPPVVDDSHKVVGQKCELSGFCKFSYCLHLSGFSLWRKTGKNWCDVQKSAQTFRHIHEARTAISSLIFFKWKGQEKLQTSATIALSWAKLGLSAGLHAQHFRITVYSSRGQSGGFSRRSPSRSTRHNI